MINLKDLSIECLKAYKLILGAVECNNVDAYWKAV